MRIRLLPLAGIGAAVAMAAAIVVTEATDLARTLAARQGPAPVPVPVAAKVEPAPTPQPKPTPIAAQAKAAGYRVRRVLEIPTPFRHGDWYWDEEGAPAAGKVVITVDLKAQTLSVFRDGYEIGTAVVLYGADWKPTPTGVYPITQKDADHVSNLYGAPMPYMLRLTNTGISIHGSADMGADGATHGCIGTPIAFARKLFDAAKLGDVVIVTNGETLGVGQAIGAAG